MAVVRVPRAEMCLIDRGYHRHAVRVEEFFRENDVRVRAENRTTQCITYARISIYVINAGVIYIC